MKNFLKNKISTFVIVVCFSWLLTSCSQVIIGGATSTSMIIVQERSAKQAAIDILIKAKIEEAMFANDYDKLFSKVRVIVYESRVLLVGTVIEESIKEKAKQISWNTKDVKEVAKGFECGLSIEKYNDLKVGDIIEGFEEKGEGVGRCRCRGGFSPRSSERHRDGCGRRSSR